MPITPNHIPSEHLSTEVLSPDSQSGEIFTDPIAPDLSAPPPTIEAPVAEPQPVPATFNETSKPPIVTILLIVIAIAAVALTSFFYIQSQRLNSQLNELSQTIDNQKISPTPTAEVTPSPTIEITPVASTSVTPIISPTVTIDTTSVWGDVKSVLALAQKDNPKAVLLMVDAAYVQPGKELIAKYWFRVEPDTKKYFYILKDSSKELSMVDQQVYLTPDNNIPSLNTLVKDDGLGIDFDKAIAISNGVCPKNFDCTTAEVSGKYIKSGGTTIWQITLKNATKSFVVQIDSLTEKIIFKNL
jgi:hypothetical protein